MKILIYGLNFSPELTGIGKYTGELASQLKHCGHDVRVLTAPPYYPQWSILPDYKNTWYSEEVDGVLVYRCPIYIPGNESGFLRMLHLLSFACSSIPYYAKILFWRPNLVWVVEPTLAIGPGAVFLARLSGAKTWLHIQDFELDVAFQLGILRNKWLKKVALKIERLILSRFDRVSTISTKMCKKLVEKGVYFNKIRYLPNWADTINIFPERNKDSLRTSLGFTNEDIIALYSGNMGQKQGLNLIIDVARRLQEVKGHSIKFVLCGEGAMKSEIMAASVGLECITWLPLQPVEQLNDLLNLADIHLLPQKAGAADLVMPSKLTNMLASGKPVLATAHEGTELYSIVRQCGCVTEPGNVESFLAALIDLANDPISRINYGLKAREYAVIHLSKSQILHHFEMEIQTLLLNGS